MALRTFRSNPSLGGFGGETTNVTPFFIDTETSLQTKGKKGKTHFNSLTADDGFAQIVKELVDNAVDACYAVYESETLSINSPKKKRTTSKRKLRRVRVVIEPIQVKRVKDDFLRVTVTDNGVGMKDIEACVSAFHTSKDGPGKASDKSFTAGRYGIGLTLCLLHAQRLVPDSCASITSSTSAQRQWIRTKYVVDTDQDCVKCISKQSLPKHKKKAKNDLDDCDSGTSVSVLLPVSLSVALFEDVHRFALMTCIKLREAWPQNELGQGWQNTLLAFF